ncbi:Hypothetical predicted protein [Mytilus galloprovincialis]|uniref:Uncharacterized protein n=1 Tax=Mytilus galloprovincialis TaxID=29158 RepID=A0A8B6DC46_MYTGA|nr:Hypothetical predicted protein [Mytilus galloprovincialis]
MADILVDRLEPAPPFTCVGADFGPWEIATRKTCGAANLKWGPFSLPVYTQGIHIQVIEEISSSSFINAFKRFTSTLTSVGNYIRLRNKFCRSNMNKNRYYSWDDVNIKDYLYKSGVTWVFNATHSSHKGGT